MRSESVWRGYFPARFPNDIMPPYYRDASGNLVSLRTSEVLDAEYVVEPPKTVAEVAESAFRCGATLVHRWDAVWGTAAGFSLPGTDCAWFLVDDFQYGKFLSLGVKYIQGLAFGYPATMYWNDEDAAARFALSQGIKQKYEVAIRSTLSRNSTFPYRKKRLVNLWGQLDAMKDTSVLDALTRLQRQLGVDPYTAASAAKTIGIINEQYTTTTD